VALETRDLIFQDLDKFLLDGELLLERGHLLLISSDKLFRGPRLLGNALFQLRDAEVFEIRVDLSIPILS
jgi:hypothetical protein